MRTDNTASPSVFKRIWDAFTSVRLTVVVLLTLAATSALGTFIPQNARPADYIEQYGEALYRLLYAFNIFDLYHSWWFQFLLLLLTVNIVVCSIDRLSAIWTVIFPKTRRFSPTRFERLPDRHTFMRSEPPDTLKAIYQPVLEGRFGYTTESAEEDRLYLFAERGRWTRIGVYIVHFSVILLLIGGLIGSFFGYEGFVNIGEGETVDTIRLKRTNRPLKLDFAIRCDDFEVSFYDTGAPEEFRSTLTIIEGGQPVMTRDVIVNDPLRYRGVSLYQSSYGNLSPESVTLSFTSVDSGMSYTRRMAIGETVEMPEGEGTFTLDRFVRGHIFMGMMRLGESLIGTFRPAGGETTHEVVLPLQHPDFDRMIIMRGIRPGNMVISVNDIEHRYYTGLQVTRDPGVWVVYIGFLIMIAGFLVAFFLSHQRLAVIMTPEGSGTRVTVAGYANKNKIGMKNRVERLARRMSA